MDFGECEQLLVLASDGVAGDLGVQLGSALHIHLQPLKCTYTSGYRYNDNDVNHLSWYNGDLYATTSGPPGAALSYPSVD